MVSQISAPLPGTTIQNLAGQPMMTVPPGFRWTEAEEQKLRVLAHLLNSDLAVAQQLLVFFLDYLRVLQRGLAVASVPTVLARFPVKWGYKKKRNDFLKLLHELDFIYVKINFRPKVRARTFALARSGMELIERLDRQPRSALPDVLCDQPVCRL
jgi:hypothetical protein